MTAPDQEPPKDAAADRLRQRLSLGAAIVAALALVSLLVWYLPWGDRLTFEQGVEIEAATVSKEANKSKDVQVKLRFSAQGPLRDDYLVFAHLDGAPACHASVDSAPEIRTTRWKAGERHSLWIPIPLPSSCEPGRVDVLAGLYRPRTGKRLAVLTPPSPGNRAWVGATEIVKGGAGNGERTLSGRTFARRAMLGGLVPWLSWLLGACAACGLLLLARGLVGGEPVASVRSGKAQRTRHALQLSIPVLVFAASMLMVLEFIKDDAYISWRYAHNLVHGRGLVFNTGERVEGITNFLWTLLLAPFEALGLDLFQVCQVLGAILAIASLFLVARLTAFVQEERGRYGAWIWGALWLASSSSFVLYANSGLEQPLAAALPIAGAWMLYRHRAGANGDLPSARVERGYLVAGLLLGAGCLTRPELHLSALLVCLPVLVDVVRARQLTRADLRLVAGVLALTVPAHLFRWLYYGTLIPNTFYVKTSNDSGVLRQGVETLRDMFGFNYTGLLLVLAPLAFLVRRRSLEKLSCLLIAISFLAYYARVGVDEMHWHRLYIPALPFVCVLAAAGVQNLLALLREALRLGKRGELALALIGWAGALVWVYADLRVTYDAQQGFNGYGGFAGTFHPDLGKFLVRHERPGGLVAFQDMGSTPYHAPDLNFLDFFGLVDRTVARARHAHGLHTFIHDNPRAQRAYDVEMRDYFFKRNPEWAILTIYAHGADRKPVADAFRADPTGAAFGRYYRNNPVQFGLWDDRRFHARYVPVRSWPRSSAYYLALWRRRDLWEQTPGEVVFETQRGHEPALAVFEGGLELLDADVTQEALEHHEAFVTSHWRLPGPMARDLTFFVHLVGASRQLPADHVPGDWMYPADRWKSGQLLEDRTLLQLPPGAITPGDYAVYLGVYRRDTGERLRVERGIDDGRARVRVGTLHVKPLVPLLHALIPRTDPARMRAHPERIVAPGGPVAGFLR